ncbi:MAG: hypothetical protein ACI39R_02480 [Lachnospiraceae bacterium]
MKKGYVLGGILTAAVVAVGILAATSLQENKKTPVENYTEKNTGTQLNKEEGGELPPPDSGLVHDGVVEFLYEDPVINNDIKHTFLAYDVVEGKDILTQTKYPLEFFGDEPATTKTQRYLDEERFKEEMPELCEAYENVFDSGLPENEIWDIVDQYKAAADNYRVPVEYGVRYIFLQCRFENVSNNEQELRVNNMVAMITDEGYKSFFTTELCYFDKTLYVGADEEASKSFYACTLQPGETLDCIIGFEAYRYIYETDNTDVPDLDYIYFGYDDLTLLDDYFSGSSPYSPIYGKFVFKVADLKEMGNS